MSKKSASFLLPDIASFGVADLYPSGSYDANSKFADSDQRASFAISRLLSSRTNYLGDYILTIDRNCAWHLGLEMANSCVWQ